MIILCYIYLIKIINYYQILNNYKIISIENINEKVETGDIVLFRNNKLNIKNTIIQIQSLFSHCGVIIEKDNKKYILESTIKGDIDPYDINDKGGVNINELIQRINKYNGNIYIIKIKYIDNEQKKLLLNNYNKYMNIDYDVNFMENYIKCNIFYKNKYNNSYMFCSEFIYNIFKDIGLVKNNKCSKCISPFDIYNLQILDKNNFYKFK